METLYIQGRGIGADELNWIGQLIGAHPHWGRFRLSVRIAQEWNWRNGAGQLKDMAARTLLIKLERRGLLQLPRRQRGGGSRPAQPPPSEELGLRAEPLLEGPLDQVRPVRLAPVQSAVERGRLTRLLQRHHYLGYRRPVGENLQYLAQDRAGRSLACLVFGAAAWTCAPRDQFIGWSPAARQRHLHRVANQMRFLVLPWVRVPHLASHLLGLVAARINRDWQSKYGHGICLLESFVERSRFQGRCYRAANWICAGQTQGRSRNDPERSRSGPCKDIYLYALRRDWRRALQAPPRTPPGYEPI